jgi:hypothetical protein
MVELDKKTPVTLVPYGLLVTRAWLKSQGLERHTLDNWVKSGKLSSLVKGVLKRSDTKRLTWQSIVCSLQRMGSSLIPGGITALELQGLGHYLSLSEKKTIHLYGMDEMPVWVNKVLSETNFIRHNDQQLFEAIWQNKDVNDTKSENIKRDWRDEFTNTILCGVDEWPLKISMPERAFFELLQEVPEHLSFEHADQIMQGLTNLSPRRLNRLLEYCTSVKVKRLFLWFAEKHHHSWHKKLDLKRFSMESGALGAGKRMLVKGGKLDPQYLITIPKEFYGSE